MDVHYGWSCHPIKIVADYVTPNSCLFDLTLH